MRSAGIWALILTGLCVVGPYVLRVPPKTRRHWAYIVTTLIFVWWILGQGSVRSH
jgi:hypothetical protein